MPRLGDMTALALAACLPMPVFTRNLVSKTKSGTVGSQLGHPIDKREAQTAPSAGLNSKAPALLRYNIPGFESYHFTRWKRHTRRIRNPIDSAYFVERMKKAGMLAVLELDLQSCRVQVSEFREERECWADLWEYWTSLRRLLQGRVYTLSAE